jgi:hypothetical protein
MQYKPIKNCHVENVILGKDFNLGAIDSFFHAFIPSSFDHDVTLWVQTRYNEPTRLLEKKTAYIFCQKEFWNNIFATCYIKCL